MPDELTTIYVILHPHSTTNPSDKYRVVDSDVWMRNVSAGTAEQTPAAGEHGTYAAAEQHRDQLNGAH